MSAFVSLHNESALPRQDIPRLLMEDFRETIINATANGARLACLMALPTTTHAWQLLAVLARAAEGDLLIGSSELKDSYPALTPACPQAHLFEREIAEQYGITPSGHPWLKPLRFPFTAARKPPLAVCGDIDYFMVTGEEIHEVAVGPVHAGIIEPGHFRFQCHGENIIHLEIALGYQHRGVERALIGGPNQRTLHYMETLAGDSSIGHASAYAQALEALADQKVAPRVLSIRAIAQELERVANHIGDLGALAGDIGFLPTQSYCGRIRGDALNMTALLCGNRFGRGLIHPGGIAYDLTAAAASELLGRLEGVQRDAKSAVDLLWCTPSVMARYEGAGALSLDVCQALGMVGPAARACGGALDVRCDHPYGLFQQMPWPMSNSTGGDVLARALVRWQEIEVSCDFLRKNIPAVPTGSFRQPLGRLRPNHVAVSLTEGWRGEICHLAFTDQAGKLAAYKVVDPSFHNWFGLAYALRGQQISDFPLCNKSFNLSYCGFDL